MRATARGDDLGRHVRAAQWPALLPPHRALGLDQPSGEPRLLDALPLSERTTLAVVADGAGRCLPVPIPVEGAEVRRAAPGDGASEDLLAALAGGTRHDGRFRITRWHHAAVTGERGVTVDQTNESVVVGEAAVVKWSVPADEGPHPAPSLLAELDRAGFQGMPRPWGALEWSAAAGDEPRLLALVSGFVPGAVDGWTWAVETVRAAAERGDPRPAEDAGRAVGVLVAEMHRALAGTATKAMPEEMAGWRSSALATLDRALDLTSGEAHRVLTTHVDTARAVLDGLPADGTTVMRVHGDLHVGQVLLGQGEDAAGSSGYLVTDFDGNPVVPSTERASPQPAAADVAGMAQSLVHVGLVVRRHHPELEAVEVTRAAGAAREAFLTAYRAGLDEQSWLLDERLLAPFAVRQVCREFTYAATHLPRWSYVPEAALPMLLGQDPS